VVTGRLLYRLPSSLTLCYGVLKWRRLILEGDGKFTKCPDVSAVLPINGAEFLSNFGAFGKFYRDASEDPRQVSATRPKRGINLHLKVLSKATRAYLQLTNLNSCLRYRSYKRGLRSIKSLKRR
jgi:hypothetical protein